MSDVKKDKRKRKHVKDTRPPSDGEIRAKRSAEFLAPPNNATYCIESMYRKNNFGTKNITGLDQVAVQLELLKQNYELSRGNMERVESMLLDQTHTLQAMMTLFTIKMSDEAQIDRLETFSRIALKAQNQCRQTLATLVELKNPRRTTFVKQQNNAINQQINQDRVNQSENSKKPEKTDNSANKLLEEIHHERLDTGTSKEAIRVNQELETLD